ncbi:hypothetical protein ACFQI7_04430 [Paenibacillus allorhizosphaerae]|uniref:Flagellar hook-length control protein FliK n=1 Tax=Paenibacillus allorhizosphaerae TaxID=2849866 RepID=A0ABM8VCA1_9BACL|nr:hypothetical protein [Paenibacillus allorhizosphaerae]CAG7623382.1 hypothetical protein PAECIP111802_00939 [Paenibacillus allorhizosphaerae]
MNISGLLRGVIGDMKAGAPKTLELKTGEVVKGTVIQSISDQEALVNIGGVQVRARLETPLKQGEVTMLQVQPESDSGQVVLKPLHASNVQIADVSLGEVLKTVGLGDSPANRQLVQLLHQAGVPLTKDNVQAFAGLAAQLPATASLDDWLPSAVVAFQKGLPLTPETVASVKQAVQGPPLHETLAQLAAIADRELDGSAAMSPHSKELLRSVRQLVDQVRQTAGQLLKTAVPQPEGVASEAGTTAAGGTREVQTSVAASAASNTQASSQASSLPSAGVQPSAAQPGTGTLPAASGGTTADVAAEEPQAGSTAGGAAARGATSQGAPLPSAGMAGAVVARPLAASEAAHTAQAGIPAASLLDSAAEAAPTVAGAGGVKPAPAGGGAAQQGAGSAGAVPQQGAAPAGQAPAAAAHLSAGAASAAAGAAAQASAGAAATAQPDGAAAPVPPASADGARPAPQGAPAAAQTAAPSGGAVGALDAQPTPGASSAAAAQEAAPAAARAGQAHAPAAMQQPPATQGAASKSGQTPAQDEHLLSRLMKALGVEHEHHSLKLLEHRSAEPTVLMAAAGADAMKTADTLKSVLLQLSQASDIPANVKEAAQQAVQQITGQQLLLTQDRTALFSHMTLFVPIIASNGEQTAAVHIQSRKGKNGRLDASNCRLVFDLQMKALGDTMIDVQVVNRIVSLHIHNNLPFVQELLETNKEEIAKGLASVGYQFISMKYSPYPEKRAAGSESNSTPTSAADTRSAQLASVYGQKPYKSVDIRL